MNKRPLPNPSPAEGGGASAADRPHHVPPPFAGEGQPARSDGRERGRQDLLRQRAKSMRSAPTDAEHRLWQILRAKRLAGHKFKRQLPIDHYIVDFACLRQRLIVEADGGQHAGNKADARRDAYLRSQGFRVLRFWNDDIFNNEEGVLTSILDALERPLSPTPPPQRGEGLSGAPNGQH
jgi:very-short-patch-repair endonuclease